MPAVSGAERPAAAAISGRCVSHFQAVLTMSLISSRRGVHPRNRFILSFAATSSGGSPGRRGPTTTESVAPVTCSTDPMTAVVSRRRGQDADAFVIADWSKGQVVYGWPERIVAIA